jgi:rSAM/selenodomain-associated transferase 1
MGVDEREDMLLVQFARSPRKGRVKTRMIPHLSAAGARDLHCELVRWTCRRLLSSGLGDVEVYVAGEVDQPLFAECRSMGAAGIARQRGADLGERMYNAIRDGLERYRCVILVGSDCPGIDARYLRRAAIGLDEAPLVLGPATDGGYVMIGARAIEPDIFRDIPWGTDTVCARTRATLSRMGLMWAELPRLTDIDRPEDLPVWEDLKRAGAGRQAVAVTR